MRAKVTAAALAIVAAVIAAGLAVRGGEAGPPPDTRPRSTYSVTAARAFKGFPIYYAGDSFEGLPLTAVLRRVDETTSYISFVYGDCEAGGDLGCAPPAEIQVWPACLRRLASYDGAPPFGPVPEETTVRAVRAASFDDGRRLEIQTGGSTVVVFARARDEALRIAAALRGVNVAVPPAAPLPEPSAEALSRGLSCGGMPP